LSSLDITASVFINDTKAASSGFRRFPRGLAHHEPIGRYRHNRTARTTAMRSSSEPLWDGGGCRRHQGRLDFGPWEQIFYGEFDGQRPKRVMVKIIGE
jgi:thiamine phosphate synthase YjbQ (UPF0047 family)